MEDEFNLEECLKENLANNAQRVSHGLNLVLELANPLRMPELLLRIQAAQPNIRRALSELNFVHFARFLPTRDGSALQVITEFDGPLEPYVMDFAIAIGEEFSMMLCFVAEWPAGLKVKDDPDRFWEFIKKNNRVHIVRVPLPASVDYPLYSAYPDATVLDIVGPRTQLPPPVANRPAAVIDHADVQGNILRGYRAFFARHFVLEVTDSVKARHWFAALAGAPPGSLLTITSNVDWGPRKPDVMLNVGFTCAGLQALGIASAELKKFPAAFRDGPAQKDRSKANGDVNESDPAGWRIGKPGEPAHAMLSLYAFDDRKADFDKAAQAVAQALPAAGLELLSSHDAQALGLAAELRNTIYFGYSDGISEPRIATPCDVPDDMQPAASPGEFLLHKDYVDVFGGESIGSLPQALASNGSFCAVRLLEQHEGAFEALLDQGAAAMRAGGEVVDATMLASRRELVAAKLMGRWRDGTPVALFPDEATKKTSTPKDATRNDFDYAPSYEYPGTFQDHTGHRCPVGAHIRRTNPRTARVAGARHSRRLIRRGMPYTIPGAAGGPAEKGLFGLFFCASLERQFEFIQQQWINGDLFASGIRDTQDPIAGAQTLSGSITLPGIGPGGGAVELKVPRLTATRGSLYLFMPGLGALRALAAAPVVGPSVSSEVRLETSVRVLEGLIESRLNAEVAGRIAGAWFPPLPTAWGAQISGARAASGFDPNAFDPTDRGFVANPYPVFAAFRADFPVYWVPRHQAHWVFTHALVAEMYRSARADHFLKAPPGDNSPRGLLTMEKARHAQVRPLLDHALTVATAKARQYTELACDTALDAVHGSDCFDLVGQFARRIPLEVLFKVMGIPTDQWAKVDERARIVLHHADRTLDTIQRLIGTRAGAALVLQLGAMLPGALRPAYKGTLLQEVAKLVITFKLSVPEAVMTLVQFVMAGYLSIEFLLSTGVRNLLLRNAASWEDLRRRPSGVDPTADQPLLRAIDEMRRVDSPLGIMDRFAGDDGSGTAGKPGISFGGLFIPQGARVVGLLGSANRDTGVFGADAEEFVIGRPPSAQQMALGAGGRECIGKPLQKLVAPIALAALMNRRPNLRLLSPAQPPWLGDPYFRSFERLMVGGH